MPLPAHSRFTFSGVFGAPEEVQEIWSWSVKVNPANSPPPGEATVVRAREMYRQQIAPLMPSDVVLTQVRHSDHAPGGLVARNPDGTYTQADDLTPVPGTGNRHFYPLQTALCVTLDTARPGASGKGRFFLPWPAFTLGGTFSLSVSQAQTIATGVQGFLTLFDTPGEGSEGNVALLGSPVVASAGGTKVPGPGFLSTVTGIRVGLVPDTMRSRRNALQESYVSRSL